MFLNPKIGNLDTNKPSYVTKCKKRQTLRSQSVSVRVACLSAGVQGYAVPSLYETLRATRSYARRALRCGQKYSYVYLRPLTYLLTLELRCHSAVVRLYDLVLLVIPLYYLAKLSQRGVVKLLDILSCQCK